MKYVQKIKIIYVKAIKSITKKIHMRVFVNVNLFSLCELTLPLTMMAYRFSNLLFYVITQF